LRRKILFLETFWKQVGTSVAKGQTQPHDCVVPAFGFFSYSIGLMEGSEEGGFGSNRES